MAINSIEGKLEDYVEGRPCIQSNPFEEMFWYIHDHGVYGRGCKRDNVLR